MLDDFFIRSIVGGIGVATVVGPLGCFVIWRRLANLRHITKHPSGPTTVATPIPPTIERIKKSSNMFLIQLYTHLN